MVFSRESCPRVSSLARYVAIVLSLICSVCSSSYRLVISLDVKLPKGNFDSISLQTFPKAVFGSPRSDSFDPSFTKFMNPVIFAILSSDTGPWKEIVYFAPSPSSTSRRSRFGIYLTEYGL